jgi:hypothetical protein
MTKNVYDINPFIYNTSTITIKINEEGQKKTLNCKEECHPLKV